MEKKQLKIIINYLNQFDVKYIDIQSELIDHFVSAVSHIQKEHPSLSFQQALMKAHQKFGGKAGFRKFRMAAENRVEKQVLKTMSRLGLKLLSWPLILKTLLAIGLAWVVTTYVINTTYTFTALMFLLAGQALYLNWRWRQTQYFLVKKSLKSLGLYLYLIVYVPTSNLILFSSASFTTYWVLTSVLLLFFLVVQGLPAALHRQNNQAYPRSLEIS